MYQPNYDYGHRSAVDVVRDDVYAKPAPIKMRSYADARPKAIILWLAVLMGAEIIGVISLFSLRSRNYDTGFNFFLDPFFPLAPLMLMGFIFYCHPRVSTLKELLRPLDIAIIAGQGIFCYLNLIFYTPVEQHPLEGDINPLVTMLFGDRYSMQELYVLSNKISAASLVLVVLLWLSTGIRGLARRKNFSHGSEVVPEIPDGYSPATAYQQQPSSDARIKAVCLWLGLFLFTWVFGFVSRAILGIVGFITGLHFMMSLVALPIGIAMGLVFYCYPRASTLKQLFRPLDVVLVAAAFFFFYLHIIVFSDELDALYLYNPVIEAIFGGFDKDSYYASEFCDKLSVCFLNIAGLLWFAIGVRGISRRQAKSAQFAVGGLQSYPLLPSGSKPAPRDLRLQAMPLLFVLYLMTYMVGIFSLLPLHNEVSLDEMLDWMGVSHLFLMVFNQLLLIPVCMSIMCCLYPRTTTMEKLFQPIDWVLIAGQCACIYLHVVTDPRYFSTMFNMLIHEDSYQLSPVSLGFLIAAILLCFAMGVRGYRRRKASRASG